MKEKINVVEQNLKTDSITNKEQADAVWEAYIEHKTKADLLLRLWGEWANKGNFSFKL